MERASEIRRLDALLQSIRTCTICLPHLPHGVRPVLQANAAARILVVGQAPGRTVHETGEPFSDASGRRLREWMGIAEETFYDPRRLAIVPMGFCYPGRGPTGDLPPRPECAPAWHDAVLELLPNIQLSVILGRHAQIYHSARSDQTLTEAVAEWRAHWPSKIFLPHPSPRNNLWFRRNPWFEAEVVPVMQRRIGEILKGF